MWRGYCHMQRCSKWRAEFLFASGLFCFGHLHLCQICYLYTDKCFSDQTCSLGHCLATGGVHIAPTQATSQAHLQRPVQSRQASDMSGTSVFLEHPQMPLDRNLSRPTVWMTCNFSCWVNLSSLACSKGAHLEVQKQVKGWKVNFLFQESVYSLRK